MYKFLILLLLSVNTLQSEVFVYNNLKTKGESKVCPVDTLHTLLIFSARRADIGGTPGTLVPLPDWVSKILADSIVGNTIYGDTLSLSNFFYKESFGKHCLTGNENGDYPYYFIDETNSTNLTTFSNKIYQQLDSVLNLAMWDNDGPDGIPACYGTPSQPSDDGGFIDFTFFCYSYNFGNTDSIPPYTSNDSAYYAIDGWKKVRIEGTYRTGTRQYVTDLGNGTWTIAHEYGHCLGLPDKYDPGWVKDSNCLNPYTTSEVCGFYSIMEVTTDTYNPSTHPRPFSPRDKLPGLVGDSAFHNGDYQTFGWISPIEIKDTKYNLRVPDFATSETLYKIPFINPTHPDSEYFLILNHQKINHWENEFLGKGVIIWHIHNKFIYGGWCGNVYFSEKKKCEDVECAIGSYDTTGVWPGEALECPEFGWDNIDQFMDHEGPSPIWFDSAHNASSRCSTDFFPLYVTETSEYKNSFTNLTNPSANGYNIDQEFLFNYGGGSYGGWVWTVGPEPGVPENIATHIALRNISIDGNGTAYMDVFLDFVQSDVENATGYNNASRFCWDGSKLLMVYNSRGHIYYTYRYWDAIRSTECWASAIPLDSTDYTKSPYISSNGKYPAMSPDYLGGINVCWIADDGLHFKRKNSTSWGKDLILIDRGNYLFSPPSIVVGSDDIVNIVLHYCETGSNNNFIYLLKFDISSYPDGLPADTEKIELDSWNSGSQIDTSYPSVALCENKPHICWDKQNKINYRYYKNTLSNKITISDSSVLSCHPCLEIQDTNIYIVYQAGNKINCLKGQIGDSIIWLPNEDVSKGIGEPGEYPVIAGGSQILWSGKTDSQIYHSSYANNNWNFRKSIGAIDKKDLFPQITLKNLGPNRVSYVYTEGDLANYQIVSDSTSVGTEEENQRLYIKYRISASPNPVIQSTVISYQLPVKDKVSIKIYDASGRNVMKLIEEEKTPGYYNLKLSTRQLETGVYFLKFSAGKHKETKKLILIN